MRIKKVFSGTQRRGGPRGPSAQSSVPVGGGVLDLQVRVLEEVEDKM